MTDARRESVLQLQAKIEIAKIVIKNALENFSRPVVVWSGGKDSTVVLHLVREVSNNLEMKMPPSLFIDHGDHFPETLEMLSRVSYEWDFRTVIARNEDVLTKVNGGNIDLLALNEENIKEARKVGFHGDRFEYSLETEVGNHLLKTVALNSAILKHRFDALFTGVRWDENTARASEIFISPRETPDHVRVQPILPFLERNVWEYLMANNLPIHPKYKEGYRSIDGVHDSKKTSNIPAWEQDLDRTSERAGRSQDKEGMMERLRAMGYM